MSLESILAGIDDEIARLTKVRSLLAPSRSGTSAVTGKQVRASSGAKRRPKRVLSAEARERIAAAQRKRWATAQKVAVK